MGRGQATVSDQFDALLGAKRGSGRPDNPFGVDDWVFDAALAGRGAEGRRLTSVFCQSQSTDNRGIVLLWQGRAFGLFSKQHSFYLVPKRDLSQYDDADDLRRVCQYIEIVMEGRGEDVGTSTFETMLSYLRDAGLA